MTDRQKLQYFKTMVGDTVNDDLAAAYLKLAEEKILNRLYPFGRCAYEPLDSAYSFDQCELAIILYNKRGAEGESAHNENGINRSYDPEEQFMTRFVPHAKVCAE